MRTRFGRIEIAKTNPFSKKVLGSRTSPYLQAKLVLLGSDQVFAQVPELVANLLGIPVNTSQVYRACQAAGRALPAARVAAPSAGLAQRLAESPAESPTPVYGMVDGSMLFTDAGWQEVKVGRVFGADAPGTSEYVAHLGKYQGFTTLFERLLPPTSPAEKVFVTDGACWIEQWLARAYPTATHILDYFHVSEKLAAVAKAAPDPTTWFEQQCQRLLAGQSRAVEGAVRGLRALPEETKIPLATYLNRNHSRMRYDLFRARHLLIGSGPIEAAHRTLIQVRMKRSGQRWSDKGGQHLLRLRTARLSHKTHLITDLFQTPSA